MKYCINFYFSAMLMLVTGILSCGTSETSNEEVGNDAKTQDTSQLNNYDNEYPNNRIHMQDTNASTDTSKIRPSRPKDSTGQ
jgi:hypothetical protein